MNLEQIKEKYGNVKLKFSSYYKYSFTFIGKADDGKEIRVSVGGHPNAIYRFEVFADQEETIMSLDPDDIRVSEDGNIYAYAEPRY